MVMYESRPADGLLCWGLRSSMPRTENENSGFSCMSQGLYEGRATDGSTGLGLCMPHKCIEHRHDVSYPVQTLSRSPGAAQARG